LINIIRKKDFINRHHEILQNFQAQEGNTGMKSTEKKAEVHGIQKYYQGNIFSFVSEDVTLPNGSRTEMAVVRHPGSTAVVPFLDDNTVVMERQYRHAVGEYLLEIPAGTMEAGELPLDCAQRELQEETGLRATRMIELGPVYILPAYSDEIIHVYIARGLIPARQRLDKDEILEVVHYPFEQTLRMITDGRITDALTILSLQRARAYLQS
jgi:ADP-ribose pyrophosphatase